MQLERDRAALSSMTTALADLTERLTAMAESYSGTPREDVASDLFEVERALRTAARRLDRLLGTMGGGRGRND
jgi:hypothetical protein